MPLLLGNKGEDILTWRASAELVRSLREKLAWKWERSPTGQAHFFLDQLTCALREELEYESRLSQELEALLDGITAAGSPDEILPLKTRYLEEAAGHFRRRHSVLALCQLLNELHDRVLSKAIVFAAERMLHLGQGSVPNYALFVSGDRGRSEQTPRTENRYFLVHGEQSSRFFLFRRQVSAALQELGLISGDHALWHGSLKEWRTFPAGHEEDAPRDDYLSGPSFASSRTKSRPLGTGAARLSELADLVLVQGDSSLASEALATAANLLQVNRSREPFLELGRRAVTLPVALGRFGRWRTERRDGEHRGKVNLQEAALDPLVQTLRVLTLHAATGSCGTVDRIHRLLEKGVLDVDLAERLLKAYQEIMQIKVERELREEEGCYLHPDELDEEAQARLRAAVEAVLTLQKVCYQRLGGAG